MNYRQLRKCELLNSEGGRSLAVDLESMLEEAYRIMGRDVNRIPTRVGLKVLPILEPRICY
jgi:hypothetical protein